MKILFILNDLEKGGIPSVVSKFANGINNNNEIVVFSLLNNNNNFFFEKDITVIINPIKYNKILYRFLTVIELNKLMKKYDFDLVIVNGEWINSYVGTALFKYRKKIILMDHSNPTLNNQSALPFLDKFIYKKVKKVLVLSNVAKKIYNDKGIKRVSVILNPIVSYDVNNNLKENNLLYIGRLHPDKGIEFLIESFKNSNIKHCKLIVLGDGELKDKLLEETRDDENILFYGNVKNIQNYLDISKILIVPSQTENYPLALLESMSAGLVPIITDCLDWRSDNDRFVYNMQNGVKVKYGDREGLINAINKLINDEVLYNELRNNILKNKELYSYERAIEVFNKTIIS